MPHLLLFLVFLITPLFSQNLYFKSLTDFLHTVQNKNLHLQTQKKTIKIALENKNLIYLERTTPVYSSTINQTKTKIISTTMTTNFNHSIKWKPFFNTNTQLSLGIQSSQNFEFSELNPNNFSSLNNTTSLNRWTSRYFIEIKQPIFRGGLLGAEKIILEQAHGKINLAQIEYKKEVENVIQQAITLYIKYTHQQRLIYSISKRVKNMEEIEHFQQQKLTIGAMEQTDLYQTKIALLNSQNLLQQQKLQLKLIESEIFNLLGINSTTIQNYSFTFAFKNLKFNLPSILQNLYSKAIKQNSNLQLSNMHLQNKKRELKQIIQNLLPKFDLTGKLFKGRREDHLLSSYQPNLNGKLEYFMEGKIEFALTGYFSVTNKFKQQVQQSKLITRNLSQFLHTSLQNLKNQIEINQKQLKTHKKIYQLNQKHHILLKRKYSQGQINYLNYLNSQNNLQETLNTIIQSSLKLQIAIVKLQQTSGTLLDYYNISL